jgi:hypothetical protein
LASEFGPKIARSKLNEDKHIHVAGSLGSSSLVTLKW